MYNNKIKITLLKTIILTFTDTANSLFEYISVIFEYLFNTTSFTILNYCLKMQKQLNFSFNSTNIFNKKKTHLP